MKKIVYIHGFKSSGQGSKPTVLKEMFGEDNVIAPTLKHKPAEDIAMLISIINDLEVRGNKILLVGSSLGGFYTLFLARLFKLSAVLINPSIRPYMTLTQLGDVNCFDGSVIKWTQKCVDDLYNIRMATAPMETVEGNNNLHFFISTDDEVIDNSNIKNEYKHVKEYDNSGHIFTRFSEILPDIKTIRDNL